MGSDRPRIKNIEAFVALTRTAPTDKTHIPGLNKTPDPLSAPTLYPPPAYRDLWHRASRLCIHMLRYGMLEDAISIRAFVNSFLARRSLSAYLVASSSGCCGPIVTLVTDSAGRANLK